MHLLLVVVSVKVLGFITLVVIVLNFFEDGVGSLFLDIPVFYGTPEFYDFNDHWSFN